MAMEEGKNIHRYPWTEPPAGRPEVIVTADGSTSLYLSGWDETYHSRHGAEQESMHVFIEAGLRHLGQRELSILEIGFGTGLNALLTMEDAARRGLQVKYTALEPYPLEAGIWGQLGWSRDAARREAFAALHEAPWENPWHCGGGMWLHKVQAAIQDWQGGGPFDLVYFDAFGPRVQPEMWEAPVFRRLSQWMKPGGILVTYCAKGQVRRDLCACGWSVERLKGPPGKREMMRATWPGPGREAS